MSPEKFHHKRYLVESNISLSFHLFYIIYIVYFRTKIRRGNLHNTKNYFHRFHSEKNHPSKNRSNRDKIFTVIETSRWKIFARQRWNSSNRKGTVR